MNEIDSNQREIEEHEPSDAPVESSDTFEAPRIDEFADLEEAEGGSLDTAQVDNVEGVAAAVDAWADVYEPRWGDMSGLKRYLSLAHLDEACARAQDGRPPALLRVEDMSEPGDQSGVELAGSYDPNDHVARIRDEMSYDQSVATVVHEGRHAYQRWAIESSNGDPRIPEWSENMEHYQPAHDDPEENQTQPVEADAYAYERAVMSRIRR